MIFSLSIFITALRLNIIQKSKHYYIFFIIFGLLLLKNEKKLKITKKFLSAVKFRRLPYINRQMECDGGSYGK